MTAANTVRVGNLPIGQFFIESAAHSRLHQAQETTELPKTP
jgi:hypothetical protein